MEAVRIGTIFAHDAKQHGKYLARQRNRNRRTSRGLTGDALEAAVKGIASIFPDNVIVGGAA